MKPNITLRGRSYEIVTLDFETYYASDYSLGLGKMNTSEYVRDERFFVHGVGIKIGTAPAQWFTGANVLRAIRAIDWENSALLCHNTAFDGFVLHEHYGVHPGLYLDTLSMSRGCHGHSVHHTLDALAKRHGLVGKVKAAALRNTKDKVALTLQEARQLGGYCIDDTEHCFELFWKMHPYLPDPELELIDMTIRMFCDPVLLVDIPRVQAEYEAEVGSKVAALIQSQASIDELMSNDKFAALLRKNGISPPIKRSLATGKSTYAFAKSDVGFQRLLEHQNPVVANLCKARLKARSTIGETRALRFLEAGKDGKPLPILLHYSGAHTHRWSGGNKMNLQNLKRGGELRRSILAPPGYSIVVCDSAQIEARILAWLAGQDDIVEAFASKKDVYKLMASALFGVPVDQVTKDQRFLGKVCVLGLGYGMGSNKLQVMLEAGTAGPPIKLSLSECERLVRVYRSMNFRIADLWKRCEQILDHMWTGTPGKEGPISFAKNFIALPNGMFLQYPDLQADQYARNSSMQLGTDFRYQTRYGFSKIYGGLLAENIVQALARCVIGEQMLTIGRKYRVVTMTHDEIVVVAKTEEADECLNFMLNVMGTAPVWAKDLPLAAEGGHDTCYSK